MNKNSVSSHIPNSLPSHVKEDYSSFVKFIQDIYSCNERRGSSLDILRNILSNKDLSVYDSISYSSTFLRDDLNETDNLIHLDDASSFPEKNGVILIGNEVILYSYREGDFLYDCYRGASYLTNVTEIYEDVDYQVTVASSHSENDLVQDITLLVLNQFLEQSYLMFAVNLKNEIIYPTIKKSTILERISSFYRSKGSEDAIIILLKLIYGNVDVSIFYPGEKVLTPSESTWFTRSIILCDLISGDINKVRDNTLFQDQKTFVASFIVEQVRSLMVGDKMVYEITINDINKVGEPIPSEKTNTMYPIGLNDKNIVVESTYGFPQNSGLITIDDEIIQYSYSTSNQFRDCVRGVNNTTVRTHSVGKEVYDFKPLIAYHEDGETVLKCLRIVNDIDIFQSGYFNSPSDFYSTGYTENNITNIPLIDTWKENTQGSHSRIADSTVADVTSYTSGVSSVHYDEKYVFVQSTSLPSYVIGPFGNENMESLIPLGSTCAFPRTPVTTIDTKINTGDESIGMFIDGVLAQSVRTNLNVYYGGVESVTVTSSGYGYQVPPVVIFNSEVGSGAAATCTIDNDGRIIEVNVTSSGAGYIEPPSVRFTSGENAIISVEVDRFGRLTSVVVTNGGKYYNAPPKLTLVDSLNRGRGGEIKIDATKIIDGVIQPDAVIIIDKGIDYSPYTYVLIEPAGSDAAAVANIPYYTYDSVRYVLDNPVADFDANGGYVYPRRKNVDVVKNTYCYSNNPISLRNELNDNVLENAHSPILGWAFDGNPIYGPYAYENPNEPTSDIVRMTSSYSLRNSRPGTGAPSTSLYPLGTFVEDYEYVENLGSLDEHNGRWCVTPEYPTGTYAYFITVDADDTPVFPYIIGLSFYSLPISQNIDFMGSYTRNTYGFTSVLNEKYYGEDGPVAYDISYVIRNYNLNYNNLFTLDVTGRLTDVTSGVLDDVYVDASDGSYVVGDLCRFHYPNTQLGEDKGCEAVVSWVVGEEISSLNIAIPNVDVILRDQNITFDNTNRNFTSSDINLIGDYIEFATPHGIVNGSRMVFSNINGNIPDGLEDNRAYFIKVVNNLTISLHKTIDDWKLDTKVSIESTGTGDKRLSPVYAFIVGRTFVTERGCSFKVITWDSSTVTLGIRVLGTIDTELDDIFPDLVNSKCKILSITTPDINENSTLIPVTDSSSFYGGDIIRVGDEVVELVEILEDNVLKVIRDTNVNPPIARGTSVTNLTRLAVIVDTTVPHNMKEGDLIEIIDAVPNIFNGQLNIDLIESETRFVCYKKLSKEDIQFILNEPITDPDRGLAYITSTKPYFLTNPTEGTLWWSTLSGMLYVRYNDTDSNQWVLASPTGVVPRLLNDEIVSVSGGDLNISPTGLNGDQIIISDVAPSTRIDLSALKKGDLWWSSSSGFLYVYYKSSTQDGIWVPATPTGISGRSDEGAIAPDISYGTGTGIQKQAVVTVSEYPPVNAIDNPVTDGDLWWSSITGVLYIRYDSKWVVATPVGTKPGEGAYDYSISLTANLLTKYTEIMMASGNYYFITSSSSVIGPVGRIEVTSSGQNIKYLPSITGIYPREIDRSIHSIEVDEEGAIISVATIYGGARYSNPKVEVLTNTGTDATFDINVVNGSIESIDVILGGKGYKSTDKILIVDTSNILIAKSNSIGGYTSDILYTVGAFQNSDPTIVPSFELDLNVTVYDVVGTFDINAEVTSASGNFTGLVKYWDPTNRVLTLKRTNGSLKENELITSLYVPLITSEDYGLVTETEESTEDYGLINDLATEDDDYGKLFEFQVATAKILQVEMPILLSRTGSKVTLGSEFVTDMNLLSESYSRLTDSYYYQNFSYVIDSEVRPSEYRNYVLKNTHPTGYIMFGQLSLKSTINVFQTFIETDVVLQ